MTDGNEFKNLTSTEKNYGVITSNIPSKQSDYKIGRNQTFVDHVRSRFGTKTATVNYNGNGTKVK